MQRFKEHFEQLGAALAGVSGVRLAACDCRFEERCKAVCKEADVEARGFPSLMMSKRGVLHPMAAPEAWRPAWKVETGGSFFAFCF